MRVKPRYKQTEVGVIPDEWEVTHLGAHGATYGGLTGKTKTDFGTGEARFVPFMNVMSNVVIDRDALDRVHVAPSESQNCVLQHDLLFNGSSETPEEVALCSVQLAAIPNLFLNSFCFGYRLRDRARIDALFLAHLFRSRTGRKFVKALAQGSTRYNISKKALLSAPLSLPPLPEQRAIATALSDVDALLDRLDRLIAKKRNLKQAALQQLLTGQTRLPGFRGEWQMRRLGDAVDTDPENLGPNTRDDFTFKYITLEDVERGILRSHSEQVFAKAPSRARRKLRPSDILVSTVRPNLQSHLLFRGYDGDWVCSTGFCVLRCRGEIAHPPFVFSQMFTDGVTRQIDAVLTGSNYPAINSGDVRSLIIPFPNLDEQTAIADVLSDMDAELAALGARRDKTRDLKQAMMQELLTGKTRLVAVGGAHA